MNKKILIVVVLLLVLITSIFLSLFYGLNLSIKILFVCMLADYLIGISMALIGKSKKGEMKSDICYRGLVKKSIMIFIVVIMGLIDNILNEQFLQKLVVFGFITTELISISEYAKVLGLDIPVDFISLIKDKTPKKESLEGEKNKDKQKTD